MPERLRLILKSGEVVYSWEPCTPGQWHSRTEGLGAYEIILPRGGKRTIIVSEVVSTKGLSDAPGAEYPPPEAI